MMENLLCKMYSRSYQMLKHLASFFALTLIYTSIVSAQDYLITFSGSGQSTTVEIVEVKNIDQQTTLTLNGTDTLLLTDVVGTGYLSSPYHGPVVYPNPSNHTSRLEFYNSSAGNTGIEVYDFSGRLHILKSIQLAAGSHAFTISGLNAGIYLLKINTPDHIYSRRLVSTSVKHLAPELQYEGRSGLHRYEPELKGPGNIVAMQYNDGERLVFKAISGVYAHTKSMVPTESQNIDFEFMDCIDWDGNQYGVVTIGEQVWMAENLKTTHYRNGTTIENPIDDSDWQNNTTGAYVWYNNNNNWKESYGALYNWYAVINLNGLCPTGWIMPSNAEWELLVEYVISQGYPNLFNNPNGAGNALKSCRSISSPLGGDCNTLTHPRWNEDEWSGHHHHGFDAFGFSSFPGGSRFTAFTDLGRIGDWWTSTDYLNDYAFVITMMYDNGKVFNGITHRNAGFSVRCIRDDSQWPTTYYLNLEVNPDDAGTVSGEGSYLPGEQISVIAIANGGWEFVNWTAEDTTVVSEEAIFTYTMPAADITITANFQQIVDGGPCPDQPILTDIDGNTYNTVLIGSQCWMKENLKTTKYRNGTPIEYPGSNTFAWEINTSGAYAWFENNISWKDKYGALYNWHAVNNSYGLCPDGWHIPTDAEWSELVDYLILQEFPNGNVINGAGNALKSCRQVNSPLGGDCNTELHPRWEQDFWPPYHHGFDEFGFSGFPGGFRSYGYFYNLGILGSWWSSTEYSTTSAWYRILSSSDGILLRSSSLPKAYGFSVRCLRNEESPPTFSLNLEVEPSGSGTVTGAGYYEAGTQVNIIAIGNQGWTFINWTDEDGVEISTFVNYLYTMPSEDVVLTANFEEETAPGQPCPGTPTVTDSDGNIYNTVLIGNQCWMRENLKTTKYRNGTPIENSTVNSEWQSNTSGAYAWYNNDISWKDSYGALYNWHAINNTNGLCPIGWHIPSDEEWSQLVYYLAYQGFPNSNQTIGAGNALKSCRQVNSPLGGDCSTSEHPRWTQNSAQYGFNEFDFSGLPGGGRYFNGEFSAIGSHGAWWSSTEDNFLDVWYRSLYYSQGYISRYVGLKSLGFSVRCLKD
jgi:uncharacterized protein (TIGR02145 family)